MEARLRLTLAAVLAAVALVPVIRQAAAQGPLTLCRERHGAAAVEVCAAAAKAHPGDEALQRRLAYLYVEIDRYDRAIETLTAMVKRWPGHWQPHYDLAQIYAFVRGYAAAVAPIEKAIALRPKDRQSLMLAAVIYSSLKRETEAFHAALRAAELGDRVAMYLVSYHYEEGLGVAADPAKAGRWLLRAAEAGHVAAMDRVTELYLEGGLGIQADDRQAELWATRARRARTGGSLR
jgi:TPR repeat protein